MNLCIRWKILKTYSLHVYLENEYVYQCYVSLKNEYVHSSRVLLGNECVFITCVFRKWMCVFISCVSREWMWVCIACVSREWTCVFMSCISREWMRVLVSCSLENECVVNTCVSREWMFIISCVFRKCMFVPLALGQGCSRKKRWGKKRTGRRSKCPRDTTCASLPYNIDPTRRQFSRRAVSGGWEETFVIRDFIADLWVVPKTSLIMTRIKHQHISASHWNPKPWPPSSGTITTYRCLIHIRDAAHSNSVILSQSQDVLVL